MRRLQILALVTLTAVGVLASVVSASAAPTDPFQYQASFGIAGVENPRQIAVNHQTGNLLVLGNGQIKQFDPSGNPVDFSALGSPTISTGAGDALYVDNSEGPTQGNIYVFGYSECFCGGERWWSFAPDGNPIGSNPHEILNETLMGVQGGAVAPDGKVWLFTYAAFTDGHTAAQPFNPDGTASGPEQPFTANGSPSGGAFDELGNFYAPGSGGTYRKYDSESSFADLGETGLPNGDASAIDPSSNDIYTRQGAKVLGVHYSDPLVPETPFEALNGLRDGGAFTFDPTGQTLFVAEGGEISVFERGLPTAPFGVAKAGVSKITAELATFNGQLIAGGAVASYHFEYGTTTAYGSSTPEVEVPLGYYPEQFGGVNVTGLQPDTTYHVRVVASNAIGTTPGPDKTFRTFAGPAGGADPCPNALARKQTIAQRVPDCRAYELVSAADAGGYDVESYLAPGQAPFPAFPLATDRFLYAIHSGAVPGPWIATNKGPDPYLATRTADGWVTDYKGLPADLNPAAGSFSSVLGEADPTLTTLAFVGPGLCSPCFASGLETGIPVRLPSGQLVQGMGGSLAGSIPPAATPEGKVAKYFSADGKKLIFASKYAFEPGANGNESELTVYERNLSAGTTEIVSTDPSGNVLTGAGISALDVSGNGSRVLIGKGISTDPQGNEYIHPYLHIAGRPGSVDLAPLGDAGVLYAGMTSDGSKVFFTSADELDGSDTDSSADLYEAAVDVSGGLSLRPVTGGNSDACDPVANSSGEHWNATGTTVDCSAVAISGGGGVASSTGAAYFLSPESFGGEGTLNEPNLYLAQPSGAISFLATLDPNDPLVLDSVKTSAVRRTGNFQTTPSGNYAAFTSARDLTGVEHFGLRNVFEFGVGASQLVCPSCDAKEGTDPTIADDVELAPDGLSLLEDGRVLFTTRFPLVLSDANEKKDVYEWTEGKQQLISAGSGPFDSALISASANGTDVFFYTHDSLAYEEDRNGRQMKVYDAREGGGFFKLPNTVPCQASDECHGPGTPAPGPTDVKSSGKTTQGNVVVCAKNRVKKRGQCVKKKHMRAKKKHHKKTRKGTAKKRSAGTNGKRGGRNA